MILLYVLAVILLCHGLAHLSGVFAPWMKGILGYTDSAWLFSNGTRFGSVTGRAYSLVWLAASALLVISAAGFILRQTFWITGVLLGAVLSLAAILPWWKAVPTGARAGALFDLILLILLLTPLREKIVNGLLI